MRFVIAVLVLLTLYLQYALWVTRGGIHDVDKLKVAVAEQKDEIARLKERNRSLAAEVMDLKQGLEAVEERSRSEMGMIKRGEVFFRITDPQHEHDIPQPAGNTTGHGAEPPLEPPLDPLVPGDPPLGDDLDAPTAPPLAVKPIVVPLVKPVVKAPTKGAKKPGAGAVNTAKAAPKPPSKTITTTSKPYPLPPARIARPAAQRPAPHPASSVE